MTSRAGIDGPLHFDFGDLDCLDAVAASRQRMFDGLDGEDLACLGMRRDSDFFAQIRRELSGTSSPAAAAPPDGLRSAAARRRRKPSLDRLVAKAKQLGVDVTVEPNGTVTFRTGTASAAVDKPQAELAEWIAKHAH
jgi:hypothetical protein